MALVHARAPETSLLVERAGPADLEGIWQLFVDCGFLYPSKLAALRVALARATLARVLSAPDDLCCSLVARLDGSLVGHVGTIQVEPGLVLFQHLAARAPGLRSRRLAGHLAAECASRIAARTDVERARIYYRPDNPWAMRVFGGFAARYATHPGVIQRATPLLTKVLGGDAKPCVAGSCALAPVHANAAALSARYAACGLELSVTELSVRGPLGGVSQGRLRIASEGMNLSELTRVLSPACFAPETIDLAAFVAVCNAHYASHGHERGFALVSDDTWPRLAEFGFEVRARYVELTLAAELVPALSDHIRGSYR